MISSRVAIDHVGLTVPDLEQAISFFTDAFGFQLVFRSEPYDDVGWVWPGQTEPERLTLRLAVLQHQNRDNLELLEYRDRAAPPTAVPPSPADPGGMHLALHVEDIDTAAAELGQRNDIRFLSPVALEDTGPISGTDWTYLLTDWGLVIELIRWAPGLPYEQHTPHRMVPAPWHR